MNLTRLVGLCAAILAFGAGCRSPEVRFYMMPTPPPNEGERPDGFAVVIAAIEVPHVIDRPQVVWREGKTVMNADDYHRWGASLPAEIRRALMEHLRALLQSDTIVAEPADLPGPDTLRLTVFIQQLDARPKGRVDLRAVYTVRRGDDREPVVRDVADVHVPVKGDLPSDVVIGYGDAVEALATHIAEHMRNLAKKAPPAAAPAPAPTPTP
jgi:uncharacterized lipoprotein YmbA